MQYKTDLIKSEFETLKTKNPKLVKILTAIDLFSQAEFGKEIVLTSIYRSLEEYKALYSANPSAMPTSLPHSKYQAADLRSSIYSQQEVDRIVAFANCFHFYGGQRKTALYHAIANGAPHFHVAGGLDT
jgi:hypothetical protein